jgi:hypothetical protein
MHVHHDKDPKFHPSKGKPNFVFSFLIFLKLVASFDIPFFVFSCALGKKEWKSLPKSWV